MQVTPFMTQNVDIGVRPGQRDGYPPHIRESFLSFFIKPLVFSGTHARKNRIVAAYFSLSLYASHSLCFFCFFEPFLSFWQRFEESPRRKATIMHSPRPFWAVFLLSALSSVLASVLPAKPLQQPDFDAVIVGGGPAGLSALSGLARVRRKALLIDSGEYRNAPAKTVHDSLGFDGVTNRYYRWLAREQISQYGTVAMTNGTVVEVKRVDTKESGWHSFFRVKTVHGGEVTARKVVLATGLRDVLPDTPGVKENWGDRIFHCPWCDGTELADEALGLLGGSLEVVPNMVREVLTLNTDLVAFTNGTDGEETRMKMGRWGGFLGLHNVVVDDRRIKRIVRVQGDYGDFDTFEKKEGGVFRVDFEEGEAVYRDGFLTAFPTEQRSRLGVDLGVKIVAGGMWADEQHGFHTNVRGVYAVGDANADNSTNVPHALYTGKRAAVYLHLRLALEDGDRELNQSSATAFKMKKRDVELQARNLWDTMNGRPGELLYAGEFDG
ncbi:thioredoxin reductase [Podospora australis]|uniref:Thioredoxin reductase n=1 Tax=Podospora australis TaxID=1536484 RepID=A0AAN6WUS2_9PEZI|nr:thioredoxin reductase [Podospora australis]